MTPVESKAMDMLEYMLRIKEGKMTPHELLDKAAGILNAKAADYTTDYKIDRYENFGRAAVISGWFYAESDKVYATLIGIKLARIASLLSKPDKEPTNESLQDSFIDAVNYLALWAGSLSPTNLYDVAKKSDTKDLCPICFNPLGTDPLNFTQIGGRLAHTACFERELECKREQERKTMKG